MTTGVRGQSLRPNWKSTAISGEQCQLSRGNYPLFKDQENQRHCSPAQSAGSGRVEPIMIDRRTTRTPIASSYVSTDRKVFEEVTQHLLLLSAILETRYLQISHSVD